MRDVMQGERIGYAEVAGPSGTSARNSGRDQPLRGLAGSSVANRFRAWTGRSGRRYVFSVFPLMAGSDAAEGLPMDGGSVVIGVERRADGTRTAVFVSESGAMPDLFFRGPLVETLRSRRGCELHVHLLGGNGAARRAIVADLIG